MDAKISVIIPTFNVEDWIGNCLDSILDQTFHNWEVIVVDDGSTDNTNEIVENYCKNYPESFIHVKENHRGPSAARNIGLSRANGEYVCFIDEDDQIAFNMLAKMYETAQLNNSDLVLCGRRYMGAETGEWLPPVIDPGETIFSNPRLLSDISSFVWDKMFRKQLIDTYRLRFNEKIHYAEDAIFIYTYLYYAKRIYSIQEALYYYTVKRKGSITGAMDERMFHEISACEEIIQFYQNKGCFSLFKDNLLWISVGFWGRKFYSFYQYPNGKKVQKRFVKEFYSLLSHYFPDNWKHFIRLYHTYNNRLKYKINIWKTNIALVTMYLYCPKTVHVLLKTIRNFLWVFRKKGMKEAILATGVVRREPYYADYLNARNKPIDSKKILYIPNSGDNIAGNPFYLLKSAAHLKGYQLVVASKNPTEATPVLKSNGVSANVVRMNSKQFQESLATAKYLVTNYRFPTYFSKRKEQVILNTWHGTPLKTLGKHMNNGIKDLGNVQSQFLSTDYLLYPNNFTKEKMMDAYCLNKLFHNHAVVSGYPRNSVFFDQEQAKKIRYELGLLNQKVFVYMPTWRGKTVSNVESSVDVNLMLTQIDQYMDDNSVLYIKLHNLDKAKIKTQFRHIRPFPEHLEIYQVLNCADCLITDYSSVFFDFVNANKEIILFLYDKEQYVKDRGVYFDIDLLPFHKVKTIEELVELMNTMDLKQTNNKYPEFSKIFCSLDSRDIAEKVNSMLLSNNNTEPQMVEKAYTVCFTPDLGIPQISKQCKELMNITQDLIFVFDQKSVSTTMERFLKEGAGKNYLYIVVQNEHIFVKKEEKAINNTLLKNLWSETAMQALDREKNRLFADLSISHAINLSDDPVFECLTRYINRVS